MNSNSYVVSNLAPGVHCLPGVAGTDARPTLRMETAMKPDEMSLKSLERIARSRGLGSLFIGGVILAFWLGGHGALYGAYRVTGAHAPAVIAEAQ